MRLMLALCALLVSVSALVAQANDKPAYVAGTHYTEIEQPVRTADPSKIEVTEVFSYHCNHCLSFEPMLQAWKKQLPEDVAFVQMHAIWNAGMKSMAQAFYTVKTLKLEDKAHMGIFTAIQMERKVFKNPEEWAEFLATFGSDKETILKTYNSFGVSSQVSQADARARGYGITGTPEMVVNGKYRVSARQSGGQAEMLKVVDFLVEKERAAKK